MTYVPKVYMKVGGDEQVIASGGAVTVESGGDINLESGGDINVASGGAIKAASGSSINAAGTLAMSGTLNATGPINVKTGVTETIESGGTLTVASGATLGVAGTLSMSGTMNATGAINVKTGVTETIESGGTLTVASGATLGVAGTLSVTGTAALGDTPTVGCAAINAAGNSQGTATAITKAVSVVDQADNTKAVKLPAAAAGKIVCIINKVAATYALVVYPSSGAKIDGGTADASVTIAAAKRAFFFCDGTDWWMLTGA